jgi:hypothetical protein
MSFSQINFENPYYCKIERPKLVKRLQQNIERIENRKNNLRLNSANSNNSSKSNIKDNKLNQKNICLGSTDIISNI